MEQQASSFARAASDAASSPYLAASAAGSTFTGVTEWLTTGPGIATACGIAMTAATFALNVWLGLRKDRREQREHETRMRAG
jgi:hypothetical protein